MLQWRRPAEIDPALFEQIVRDFRRVWPYLRKRKVVLSDGDGYGEPRLDRHGICFNGAVRCGHRPRLPNVRQKLRDYLSPPPSRRACPGSCAFETFLFPRVSSDLGSRCQTDRRHYELAVQVCLLAAKFHLGPELTLGGVVQQWDDARMLCQKILGYGDDLLVFEEGF